MTQISEEKKQEKETVISYSNDINAKWTIKAKKPYYGYKIHMSTDFCHGFITGGHVTAANRSDTRELISVIKESEIKKGILVLADKGYSSLENREKLTQLGHHPGIMYKAHRNKPLSKSQKRLNALITSILGTVERTFGTLKFRYGLHRAKYFGIIKTKGHLI